MRLLLIRHGDPDYERDTLTEKGRREADYLAERLSRLDIAAFYTSPLGRAKDTAAPTLARVGWNGCPGTGCPRTGRRWTTSICPAGGTATPFWRLAA